MHEMVVWQVGNSTVHATTLVMTWIVMAAIIIFTLLGVRNLTSGKPGKFQNILEWLVDFIKNLVSENMDYKKGAPLLSYLLTLILFIFFSNMIGLVPNFFAPFSHNIEFANLNEIFHGPVLMSPTADINTTMGLAALTIILVIYLGIKHKGAGYFRHFIEPNPLFLPIHIVDILSKPMTLAFRLFGNIYAGEVLIAVILMLPGFYVFGGVIGPMPIWLGFSIFIGTIQSFVFTVLTIAYVAQAVAHDH